MKTIHQCPCCGGAPSGQWPALTAPFIAEYALKSPVSLCSLLECGSCSLRFFDHRFEEEELQRLYCGYRGEAYFQARHLHEPWYLRRHNDGTGHAPGIQAARKAATVAFLRRHTDTGLLSRVIDYGGDSGQFIPDDIGIEKHVFEVSDAVPISGVRRISDEDQLQDGGYDLVLLNHVLEHSAEPLELLRRVARLMAPGTGILHVEVPREYYNLAWVRQGPDQAGHLAALASHPTLLKWLDFYSTVFRVAVNAIPPFGFLKLHEHINLFNEQALAKACEAAGLEVLAVDVADRGAGAVVAALARHRGRPRIVGRAEG